jgi:hypothetical protein
MSLSKSVQKLSALAANLNNHKYADKFAKIIEAAIQTIEEEMLEGVMTLTTKTFQTKKGLLHATMTIYNDGSTNSMLHHHNKNGCGAHTCSVEEFNLLNTAEILTNEQELKLTRFIDDDADADDEQKSTNCIYEGEFQYNNQFIMAGERDHLYSSYIPRAKR